MTSYIDALSAPANLAVNAPQLLLKTLFGPGVTVGASTFIGNSANQTQGWRTISGTDSLTGYQIPNALYSYMNNATAIIMQELPDIQIANDANYATNMAARTTTTLAASTISSVAGAQDIIFDQKVRNSGNPQTPFMIKRNRSGGVAIADMPSIYYKFTCKLDSNIQTALTGNDSSYQVITEFKAGDYGAAYSVGDYRFNIIIRKNASNQLYFAAYGDNVANGVGVIPVGTVVGSGLIFCLFNPSTAQINVGDTVTGATSGATAYVAQANLIAGTWASSGKGNLLLTNNNGISFINGEPLKVGGISKATGQKFYTGFEDQNLDNNEQKYFFNTTAPGSVPLGVPVTFEVYVKRPANRQDITTGITQAVMSYNGTRLTLCNQVGGIQMGAVNLPITRIMIMNQYSSGTLPLQQQFTELEIWNTAPITMIL